MNALVIKFEFEPLPFAPKLYADETLWSWMTRTALYWGFSAEGTRHLLQLASIAFPPRSGLAAVGSPTRRRRAAVVPF